MVNVLWHASTTAVHGKDCQKTEDISSSWDCQNTAIVVGEIAVELRPYIQPRNIRPLLLRRPPKSRFLVLGAEKKTKNVDWSPAQADVFFYCLLTVMRYVVSKYSET